MYLKRKMPCGVFTHKGVQAHFYEAVMRQQLKGMGINAKETAFPADFF